MAEFMPSSSRTTYGLIVVKFIDRNTCPESIVFELVSLLLCWCC
jgi:hypothetical protein